MSVTIVAELSANHCQDLDIARATLDAIAESGADAVKFQTYTPDTITLNADTEPFHVTKGTLWEGETLYRLYERAYLPWEWHWELRDRALSLGLEWFSAPFDPTAVDFLEQLGTSRFKIASFEITDMHLIEYTASKRKPMVLSTGVATAADIHEAVSACRKAGNDDITVLQCTSSYPAPIEGANLRMVPNLSETFGVKSGISDHTPGSAVAVAAAALGATMIEKHVILDRSLDSPDAAFSMEPEEFAGMVSDVRSAAKAIGVVDYSLTERKSASRRFARSLFVVNDVREGEILSNHNVRSIRPNDGLPPKLLPEVLGKPAARNIAAGTPLEFSLVDWTYGQF